MKSFTTNFQVGVRKTAAGAALGLLLFLTGCARREQQAAETSTSYAKNAASDSQPKLFSIPAEQMSHIQIVEIEPVTLERVLRLSGTVSYNAFETTPVITQVGGPVSRIVALPGQMVRQGQPLLYVSSPDYAQLRTNYLKSLSAFQLADKTDARARDLYAHHAIAEVDLQSADSAREQALADLQASEQALKVLGVTKLKGMADAPASPEIPVLAPIAGEVVERLASPGQVVQAGATQVFTISNMSTVWVLANVYERDLGYVHVGNPVTIHTDAYPEDFTGRISYVAPAVDATTRTLQVRIVTSNPHGELKKDMYVTAIVKAGEIPNAIAVPDAAVLRNSENQPFVYLQRGNNQYGQQLVDIGGSHEGKTQILSGLQAGQHVVADGSLFLQFANSFQR